MEEAATVARQCSGCGARVELPAGEVSTKCSYCGSPLVDSEKAAHHFDAIAPFRIERTVAQQRLREYLGKKLWAPKAVRRTMVDGRDLRGLLVPFWTYDGVVRSEYDARIGIHWYRTETYTDGQGKTRTRTVKETEWFHMEGTAARRFADHLVSGSVGLPEAESNALEPFDLGWAVPFDARLISGWEAELPSVDKDRADQVALAELRDLEAGRIASDLLPGDVNTLQSIGSHVEVENRSMVLLPVWVASFSHADNAYRLLVNGQSGTCRGEVPISVWKVSAAVLAGVIVLVLVLWYAGVFG
jgi:hypothetical protein